MIISLDYWTSFSRRSSTTTNRDDIVDDVFLMTIDPKLVSTMRGDYLDVKTGTSIRHRSD